MLNRSTRQCAATIALSLLSLVASSVAILAATSERAATPAVSAQLITAENGIAPGAGTVSAGLALVLGEGWKTYWRTPGEVGFPPEIDWTGSRNVAEVELLHHKVRQSLPLIDTIDRKNVIINHRGCRLAFARKSFT